MSKSQEHWAKSGWAIGIGTTILSFLLSLVVDYFKEIPILSTLENLLKSIVIFVWSVLNYNIKVWWIAVTLILLIAIIYLFDKFLSSNNSKTQSDKPDFYSYKEDKLKKWRWTWNWVIDQRRKSWVISNLKAHCPDCDTQLIAYYDTFSGTYYKCPRCNFSASDYECEDPQKIEILIHDNIDRKRKSNSL